MFKLNQKGMTLVETMVAAGLLGGLAVAGMTLFKTQNKAQKTVEQNYEVTATLGAIRSILADQDNCSDALNLGGLNPTTTQSVFTTGPRGPGILKNGTAPRVYAPNTDLPGTQLKIVSYTLTRGAPYTAGLAADEAIIAIVFSRGQNVQTDIITKTVKINFTGNPITNCYAVTSGASDSLWQIEGAGPNIYYASGRVGVGSSSPAGKLQIAGSSENESNLMLNNTGTPANNVKIQFQSQGNEIAAIYANSPNNTDGSLSLRTASGGVVSTRMNILANGNVGINTTTPNNSLHVYTAAVSTGALIQSGQSQSALAFRDPSTTVSPQVVGIANDLYLQTSGSDRLRVLANGNVGIGTATPTTKFHVNDSAGTIGTFQSSTNYVDLVFRNSVSSAGYLQYIGNNWNFFANSGGTPTMTITGATAPGNVGIGTTAPTQKLQISGSGNPQTATNTSSLRLDNTASGRFAIIGVDDAQNLDIWNSDTNGTGAIRFLTSSGTGSEKMRVSANGNIGINTINPLSNLDVNGWIQATTPNVGTTGGVRIKGGAGNTNAYLQFTNNAGTGEWGYFGASSAGHMFAGPVGNFGIGVDTPSQKLHVVGSVLASGYLYISDRRLKEEIKSITHPLQKVAKLEGRSFSWKDSREDDIGFIAQDVEKVVPELVVTNNDGFKSVKYGNITALLVEAVKEIKNMIDTLIGTDEALKEEIEILKDENTLLKSRLDAQELRMKRQEKILSELQMRSKK
jgi:type II secretory pathway pseudopilin PulG